MQLLIRDPEELDMTNPRFFVEVTTFNDQEFGRWTTYSVEGEEEWETNNQGSDSYYATISGYPNVNEDWLISPAYNLDKYKNERLSFMNASNYGGPKLEVKISSNYSGSGDPTEAVWSDLSGFMLSEGDFKWVYSGEIDLSTYVGSNVYVAFVYKSESNSGRIWEVDDITIIGDTK
jgi:hypothetical protein